MRGRTEQRQRAEHEKAEKLRADARAVRARRPRGRGARRTGEGGCRIRRRGRTAGAGARRAGGCRVPTSRRHRRRARSRGRQAPCRAGGDPAQGRRGRPVRDDRRRPAPHGAIDATRTDVDGDGRADVGTTGRTTADRDAVTADDPRHRDRRRPADHPPAGKRHRLRPSTHDDPAIVDDAPETRRDRTDRV